MLFRSQLPFHPLAASGQWMKRQLKASYEPLLEEPWVLDVDTTVKPLYGHRQDAKVGYNPTKPGPPSHAYHSYFVGNIHAKPSERSTRTFAAISRSICDGAANGPSNRRKGSVSMSKFGDLGW